MRSGSITGFTAVDDRFGFSRKGIFNCRIKHEYPICIALTVVTGLIWSSLFGYAFGARVTLQNSLFMSVFGLIIYALLIVIPFIFIGTIRTILSGETYSYIINEEKMLITCPRKDLRVDILVKNVLSVEYRKITLFGKNRGYSVTIYCKDGEKEFDFLFPQRAIKTDIDMTPFRLLEERAGLIERPEFLAGKRIDDGQFK